MHAGAVYLPRAHTAAAVVRVVVASRARARSAAGRALTTRSHWCCWLCRAAGGPMKTCWGLSRAEINQARQRSSQSSPVNLHRPYFDEALLQQLLVAQCIQQQLWGCYWGCFCFAELATLRLQPASRQPRFYFHCRHVWHSRLSVGVW